MINQAPLNPAVSKDFVSPWAAGAEEVYTVCGNRSGVEQPGMLYFPSICVLLLIVIDSLMR